ncbi:MAG: hypothetical protein AAGC74_04185 [Verrucomicrobiota bacterium]
MSPEVGPWVRVAPMSWEAAVVGDWWKMEAGVLIGGMIGGISAAVKAAAPVVQATV